MLNRSEILRDTWKRYRALPVARLRMPFDRSAFAYSLRMAWAFAKRQAEVAILPLVPEFEPRVVSAREQEIRSELLSLQTASRINWQRYDALRAELHRIA